MVHFTDNKFIADFQKVTHQIIAKECQDKDGRYWHGVAAIGLKHTDYI